MLNSLPTGIGEFCNNINNLNTMWVKLFDFTLLPGFYPPILFSTFKESKIFFSFLPTLLQGGKKVLLCQ